MFVTCLAFILSEDTTKNWLEHGTHVVQETSAPIRLNGPFASRQPFEEAEWFRIVGELSCEHAGMSFFHGGWWDGCSVSTKFPRAKETKQDEHIGFMDPSPRYLMLFA